MAGRRRYIGGRKRLDVESRHDIAPTIISDSSNYKPYICKNVALSLTCGTYVAFVAQIMCQLYLQVRYVTALQLCFEHCGRV